jgi:hypothetical protein
MVFGRFNLLHHVTDDAVPTVDIEWITENLLLW